MKWGWRGGLDVRNGEELGEIGEDRMGFCGNTDRVDWIGSLSTPHDESVAFL
jgi:hypothetical protein